MQIVAILFWSFWGDLLVLLPLALAIWLWDRQQKKEAVLCSIGGAISSSLVVYLTESLMRPGYTESISTALANALFLSVFITLCAIYLATESKWSNWKIDLLLGVLLGAGLAITELLTLPDSLLIDIAMHTLAFSVGGAVALVGMRLAKSKTLSLVVRNALLITVVLTCLLAMLDFW